MTKEARIYNGEKTASLVSSVGKTEKLQAKEWSWTTYTTGKNKIKGIKYLNVKPETVKYLEVARDSVLLDPGLRNIFFCLFLICLNRQEKQKQK